MSIPDLIANLLGVLRNQFYADTPREFLRDERALTKAIARYGYECAQRGWHFEPQFMQDDILKVLNEIKRTGAEIGYLPVYLEGAVDRHIRQRAEELSAKAKASKLPNSIKKVLNGFEVVEAVREPTHCETLGLLWQQLAKRKKAHRAALKQQPKVKPLELFAA
jgi:hypothetical protein